MPNYRRNRVSGGTYFFTVNLLDRRSDLLVRHVDALRTAIRDVRRQSPFRIEAWVVLPDHMHCL
jgi:putative transposase